jgi:hypothetical protein
MTEQPVHVGDQRVDQPISRSSQVIAGLPASS